MGSTTSGDLALYKPATDETGWGSNVNSNCDTIDTEATNIRKLIFKAIANISDGDTTPSVSANGILKTNNSGSTTITDFDDPTREGELQLIEFGDANTTIADGSGINLKGATNKTYANGDWLLLAYDGTDWNELTSSDKVQTAEIEDSAVTSAKIAANTIAQGDVANSAVGRGELKTAQEEQSSSATSVAPGALTFSNVGQYGFFPETKGTNEHSLAPGFNLNRNSYGTRIIAEINSGTATLYARIRYVQSSPPHFLLKGDQEDWGHWVFYLLDDTGDIQRAWAAEDPPWWLRARGKLPKQHPGRFLERWNPFVDDVDFPLPAGWELRMVDLRSFSRQTTPWSWKEHQVRELSARRQEMLSAGIPAAELDQWESLTADDRKDVPRIEVVKNKLEMANLSILDLLHSPEKASGDDDLTDFAGALQTNRPLPWQDAIRLPEVNV